MMRLATSLQPDFGRLGLEDLDLDLNTPLSRLPRLPAGFLFVVRDGALVKRNGSFVVKRVAL